MKSNTTLVCKLALLSHYRRWAGFLLMALMITLGLPASAGTIGISDGTLIVGTEPGDANQLFSPTIAGLDLVLPNLDFEIVTPGCTAAATAITCALAGFQDLVILGGDGDDVIQLTGITGQTFGITALGGAGDDLLIGTPGNVKLFGGTGDDILEGAKGNCLSGGSGLNIVFGGGCDPGPDPIITPLPRQVTAVPEPGSLLLMGTGLLTLALASRMRFRRLTPVPRPSAIC